MRQHYIVSSKSFVPLIGVHVFGIIDRGTNLLQIRPISGCPLNCIFCSVDEGRFSRKKNTYEVEVNYFLREINKVIAFKEADDIEAHIDGIGEPMLYKDIVKLVAGLKANKSVKIISMQTHGTLLTAQRVKELEEAGLTRFNLSIDTLDAKLAKELTGTPYYDIEKIKNIAKIITQSNIELMITPVIVPGYNDKTIDELIEFAKSIEVRLGIQKYERQKHGRRLKVKEWTWYRFRKWLKELEKKHNYKLVLSKKDFNIHKTRSLPIVFKKGEIVRGKIVFPGWLDNEVIIKVKNRLITVFNSTNKIGDIIKAKIVKIKHNLYLGDKI